MNHQGGLTNANAYRVARDHVERDLQRFGRDPNSRWNRPRNKTERVARASGEQTDLFSPPPEPRTPEHQFQEFHERMLDFYYEVLTAGVTNLEERFRVVTSSDRFGIRYRKEGDTIIGTVDVAGFRFEARGSSYQEVALSLASNVARGHEAAIGQVQNLSRSQLEIGETRKLGRQEALQYAAQLQNREDPLVEAMRAARRHFSRRLQRIREIGKYAELLHRDPREITDHDRSVAEKIGVQVREEMSFHDLAREVMAATAIIDDERFHGLTKNSLPGDQLLTAIHAEEREMRQRNDRYADTRLRRAPTA